MHGNLSFCARNYTKVDKELQNVTLEKKEISKINFLPIRKIQNCEFKYKKIRHQNKNKFHFQQEILFLTHLHNLHLSTKSQIKKHQMKKSQIKDEFRFSQLPKQRINKKLKCERREAIGSADAFRSKPCLRSIDRSAGRLSSEMFEDS